VAGESQISVVHSAQEQKLFGVGGDISERDGFTVGVGGGALHTSGLHWGPQGPLPNSSPATLIHASYSERLPPSQDINQEIRSPQVYCPARAFQIVDVQDGHPQKVFSTGAGVGFFVGRLVGLLVGLGVGEDVGFVVGAGVGFSEGFDVGICVSWHKFGLH